MSILKIAVKSKYGVGELTESTVDITVPGVWRSLKFVHISDLHIASSEASDTADIVELVNDRNKFWQNQAGFYCTDDSGEQHKLTTIEVNELVAERIHSHAPDAVFITGDTVDFPSAANFRRTRKYLDSLGCRCILTPGNHDAVGDDADNETKHEYNAIFGANPEYSVEKSDGIDIVSFDDGLVRVTDLQVKILGERLRLGHPMIVLLHVPVLTESAKEKAWPFWGYNWLVGEEQHPAQNRRFRELLCERRDLVRAVFAGHIHLASGDGEPSGERGEVTQYTAAPAFTGFLRVVHVHG